jgi:hypothetical protein
MRVSARKVMPMRKKTMGYLIPALLFGGISKRIRS